MNRTLSPPVMRVWLGVETAWLDLIFVAACFLGAIGWILAGRRNDDPVGHRDH